MAGAEQLVRRAQAELDQIGTAAGVEEKFLHAHMAALRAGAALLTLYPGKRRGVRSVWEQIAELDQQWVPWATLFAAGAPIRAAIETGRDHGVDEHRAARAERAAADFLDLVAQAVRDAREQTDLPALAS